MMLNVEAKNVVGLRDQIILSELGDICQAWRWFTTSNQSTCTFSNHA